MGEVFTEVRELITKLGWDVDEDTIKRFDRAVGTAKVGLLALVGASVAAGAALLGVTISAARAGEEVLATAELVGLTVEEFQKYRHAAALAEIGNEQFATSIRFLTRNIGDAIRGQGEAGKAFQKLGITLTDASGKTRDSGAILRDVADGFQRIDDPATRASLSMDLFGRGGLNMGRFLVQGSAGLEAASAAVSTFGLFTDATAKEADAMGDSLLNLKALAGGLRNELGQRLFKTVRDISERMQKWLIANAAVIKQKLDKFVERLTQALALLMAVGERVVKFFLGFVELLGGFDNAVKLGLFALTALTVAFATLAAVALVAWADVLLLPALVAAAVFALILVIEDLYVWMQGGDSVIGQWLGNFEKFRGAWNFFLESLKEIWTGIKSIFDGMASIIAGFFTFIIGLFTGNGNLIIEATDEMLKGIMKILDGAASIIAGLLAAPFIAGFNLIKKATPDWLKNFLAGAFKADIGISSPGGFTGGFGGPNLAAAGLAGGFSPSSLARPSVVAGAQSNSKQSTANVTNYITVPKGTTAQEVDGIKDVVREELRRTYDHVNQENPEVD